VQAERALRGRPAEDLLRQLRDHTIPYTYAVVSRGFSAIREMASTPAPFPPPPNQPRKIASSATRIANQPPGAAEIERRELLRSSFEPALISFVRLAKAWGSEPILMTQVRVDETVSGNDDAADFLSPDALRRGNFDRASFGSLHDYGNAIIRHVALTEGAILIDLVTARRWTRDDVYDGVHFTESGSRHVAEIITQALTPLIVPPPS
jgi:hypothetical protein